MERQIYHYAGLIVSQGGKGLSFLALLNWSWVQIGKGF